MQGAGSASAFSNAARDATLIKPLDPLARDLEGYLFPETYRLNRRTDPSSRGRLMVDRLTHILTPERRRAAEARGLSIHQLVTLASLVEKETARPEERPMV